MRGVRGEVEYLLALLHLHSVHCHVMAGRLNEAADFFLYMLVDSSETAEAWKRSDT